jgi:hypothetical protein
VAGAAMTTINFCARFIVRGDFAMIMVTGDVAESSDTAKRHKASL